MGQRRNIKILLEYDGRRFRGWSSSGEDRTVASRVTTALTEITGQPVTLNVAVRTDPGVHAEEQVANALLVTDLPEHELGQALEEKLPGDIALLDLEDAPEDFHAQHQVQGVSWRLQVRWRRSALDRRCWLLDEPVDAATIKGLLKLLPGRQDLAPFTGGKVRKDKLRNTVVNVQRAELRSVEDGFDLFLSVSRHLPSAVRRLLGATVAVARDELSGAHLADALQPRPKLLSKMAERLSELSASPHGLFLEGVKLGGRDRPRDGTSPTALRAKEALERDGR
ncbi:MAG: hypothetical protein AAF533_00180 [Acidobacteriota bacterium]